MKRLILLRHAKSSWSHEDLRDFDRPLNKRGRRDAVAMGHYIHEHGLRPDTVLCSGALRTRETAAGIINSFDKRPEIETHDGLYLAAPSTIIKYCQNAPVAANTLMVIAHNPGMQDTVITLADATAAPKPTLASISAKFPTAALAVLEFQISSWTALRRQAGALIDYQTPKQIQLQRHVI